MNLASRIFAYIFALPHRNKQFTTFLQIFEKKIEKNLYLVNDWRQNMYLKNNVYILIIDLNSCPDGKIDIAEYKLLLSKIDIIFLCFK
jgi:hypothetical protein